MNCRPSPGLFPIHHSSLILHHCPSAPLEVREVRSRSDLDRFIKLPWRIYAEDPHWVPPLLMEVKEFLNRRKHPFYKHGDATQFIAMRGDETVGRILVSDDPRYNQERGENVGCFGMFECDNDQAAAHGLLDAAAGWLAARGRTAIRGPIDYSLNYPCGLLVEGFDTPPRIMMNHNRRYYAGLLESWGLREGEGSLRMVVRRSARSVVEVAPARRAACPARQDHRAAFPAERLPRRGRIVARRSTTRRWAISGDSSSCRKPNSSTWPDN